MPFISIRDIRVYYEIHGSGPGLLLFSGTGGDLRRKPNIFQSPLSKHFEILAHDQRGLGQTDRPDVPYTMNDYAMDADSLLEAIGWESCLVMGVSFGGMVAQEFALSYPHRVERLVLACTSSGGAGGDSYPLHEFSDFSPEERALRVIPLSDTRRDKAWQSDNPDLFKKIVDDTLAGARIGENEPGRKIGAQRQLEARMGHNTYERLPNLKMPVYICGGLYDGIAPKANLEAIHKQIPKSHLEFFEGGHLFLIQDKRAYARIVVFLKGELDDDS